jgi:hypothetical protein
VDFHIVACMSGQSTIASTSRRSDVKRVIVARALPSVTTQPSPESTTAPTLAAR